MRIAITGDWHLRLTRPTSRIDNYWYAQQTKLHYFEDKMKDHDCSILLQPGDLVDHFKISDETKREIILLLSKLFPLIKGCPQIFTVFGQHDMRYHSSNRNNTPLGILDGTGIIEILGKKPSPKPFYYAPRGELPVFVYGASWGEEIPPIEAKKGTHILVIHKTITKGTEWKGTGDFTPANIFLMKNKFDLVVCGDNHEGFWTQVGESENKRFLVNCGSLMRSDIDQTEHKPTFYIYNTKDRSLVEYEIPIEPPGVVFNLEEAQKEKKENEKLKALIKKVGEGTKIEGINFLKNLKNVTEKLDPRQGVKDIINESAGESK